jgi:Sec-independent protein translocase protein TatA
MRRLSLLDWAIVLTVVALLLGVARTEFGRYAGGVLEPRAATAPTHGE